MKSIIFKAGESNYEGKSGAEIVTLLRQLSHDGAEDNAAFREAVKRRVHQQFGADTPVRTDTDLHFLLDLSKVPLAGFAKMILNQ